MNCPVCQAKLTSVELLQSSLPAYMCPSCGGIWISANEYMRWHEAQHAPLPERPADLSNIATLDSPNVKLCPADGHFLRRYQVLANEDFFLDRCTYCRGIWFDKGEWDYLVARNLHDKVDQFFTHPYRTQAQQAQTRTALEQVYLDQFGEEDYRRIKEIRDWLKDHPNRKTLLAYLNAENPYQA